MQSKTWMQLFHVSSPQMHTHPLCILCVFGLKMKAGSKSVCQGVSLVDRWFSGWFYEEIPVWSQLGWSEKIARRDEWGRGQTALVIWWRGGVGLGNKTAQVSVGTHTHRSLSTCTKWSSRLNALQVVWDQRAKQREWEKVLSLCVSSRAAKSSSTTKSATDLISPQMDS